MPKRPILKSHGLPIQSFQEFQRSRQCSYLQRNQALLEESTCKSMSLSNYAHGVKATVLK